MPQKRSPFILEDVEPEIDFEHDTYLLDNEHRHNEENSTSRMIVMFGTSEQE